VGPKELRKVLEIIIVIGLFALGCILVPVVLGNLISTAIVAIF
jgi:hypothetical protein